MAFHRDHYQVRSKHFISVAWSDQLCFLSEQPNLESLPKQYVVLEEGELEVPWIFHEYHPNFFEIDY